MFLNTFDMYELLQQNMTIMMINTNYSLTDAFLVINIDKKEIEIGIEVVVHSIL